MTRIPLAEVGRTGRMELRIGSCRGTTTIRHLYCEVPFKASRIQSPRPDGISHLILMNCTAGIFGGDRLECSIHVERGARVRVTQQSAVKIHPSNGETAVQLNRIHVEEGAELYLENEPVIPFGASRFRQQTAIDVDAGGRLFFWESFMAGRAACGERWEFEELSSETCLRASGRMIYLDRWRLLPRHARPDAPWKMAAAAYSAAALCVTPDAELLAGRLHESVPAAGVDVPAPGLVLVRVVCSDGPAFHEARRAVAACASSSPRRDGS